MLITTVNLLPFYASRRSISKHIVVSYLQIKGESGTIFSISAYISLISTYISYIEFLYQHIRGTEQLRKGDYQLLFLTSSHSRRVAERLLQRSPPYSQW